MGICPWGVPVAASTVVLATAHICPAHSVLPCRVVYYTDEATSFGSVYGTLPGHPERGEESRQVRLEDQGVASFHVVAFSRPSDLATRWLAHSRPPSSRWRRAAAYVNGMKRYAEAPPTPDKRAREVMG